jgi:hypothetical protein
VLDGTNRALHLVYGLEPQNRNGSVSPGGTTIIAATT